MRRRSTVNPAAVGDKGVLKATGVEFVVNDTQKYGRAIGHRGKLAQGSLKLNDRVDAQIDAERRNSIRLNHSATHLLHAALRKRWVTTSRRKARWLTTNICVSTSRTSKR